MNRRQFCQSSIAASIVTTYPVLYGCGESAPTARNADTSIAAVSLNGAGIELERAAIRELGDALDGPVILAGHPGYDEARKVWNGMHDKRPALIAQCSSSQDVSNAVTFARERSLLLAVRGGGHSWPGKSTCNGGLVIDLSPINRVTVDPDAQQANAGGGALLHALDTAALEHGLITTTGVVSHTGVGGLTLGGGFGRLARRYGLTIDNLLGAEVITADGRIRTISTDNEPDLFWAIRGGGGNFGVITRFIFRLHPFERNILSGAIVWPIAQAREVLDFYSDWHLDLSDELYATPVMATQPDGTSVISITVVYNGNPDSGEKELTPLRNIGKPLMDKVKEQDYMVTQTQMDGKMAHGIRSYAKSGMARAVTPELVDAMIDAFVPDARFFLSPHTAGGAVRRVDESATAFPHRNAEIMLAVIGAWTDPDEDESAISGLRAWYSALEPFTGGYYSNIDFDRDTAVGGYGPAYKRLARIKGQYDPDNLFRLNSNIKPSV